MTLSKQLRLPHWLPILVHTTFYGPCPDHPRLRRNELNLFDTNAARKICHHCRPALPQSTQQQDHDQEEQEQPHLLHISRYMYHDVVSLREASAWLDVTHVQPYLNNGYRVLYLDRSGQPKSRLAPNAASCSVCQRTLQHPYLYCSLLCKFMPNNHAAVAEKEDEEEKEKKEKKNPPHPQHLQQSPLAPDTRPNTPQSSADSTRIRSPLCSPLPPPALSAVRCPGGDDPVGRKWKKKKKMLKQSQPTGKKEKKNPPGRRHGQHHQQDHAVASVVAPASLVSGDCADLKAEMLPSASVAGEGRRHRRAVDTALLPSEAGRAKPLIERLPPPPPGHGGRRCSAAGRTNGSGVDALSAKASSKSGGGRKAFSGGGGSGRKAVAPKVMEVKAPASDIRKSRRKGHPIHSPAGGPKMFALLRHTLQPLVL